MLLLFSILIFASFQDARTGKISNWLILIGMILGFVLQTHLYGLWGIFQIIITCVVPFFILFPLFKIGVLGAGDIKIFIVMGFYMNLTDLLICIIISFIIAAIPALVKLYKEESLKERMEYLNDYLGQLMKTKEILPYYFNEQNEKEIDKTKIHMTIPILLSFLLHMGGVY